MRDKKVLYFASSKGIGFTGHLSDLAVCAPKDGRFVFVSGDKEQFPGTFKKLYEYSVCNEVVQGLDTKKSILKHCIGLASIIKKHNLKILHSQTHYQLLISSILKLFFNVKVIQTIHAFNNGRGGVAQALTKLYISIMCFCFVDKVIFQCNYVAKNFPLLKRKGYFLPMGFQKLADGNSSDNSQKPFQLIYSAKFHAHKNHMWLIDNLMPLLKSKKIKLLLPGNGAYWDQVNNYVMSQGLSESVFLPGWINKDSMHDLYLNSYLAVVPSLSETLGHNIIEPLSYGIPVISFPVGIAPDIATVSQCVTVIDFGDADDFSRTVRVFIEDHQLYNDAAKEAASYFKKNLTWESYMNRYDNLVKSL